MSPIRLEEFGQEAPASGSPVVGATDAVAAGPRSTGPDEIEKARLAGFEEGYQAGWDDAARKDSEEQSRIGAEFARNLQDLGFTFHEARAHVMQALEPLLTSMVERVLPKLVSDSIGQTIIEELLPLAAEAADTPIDVVVPPASRTVLEELLGDTATVPFRVVEEATLAEGQVYLRSSKSERHIDMTLAVDRIGAAIEGLYELNEKAFQNG